MKDETTTIDSLAIMVKEGFDRVEDKMTTKEDLSSGLNSLKVDIDNQFGEVNRRLDNLEFIITKQNTLRIERLEENMSTLMKATGLAKI